MRLYLYVELDTGGRVTVSGHDLSVEDVNETFAMLAGHVVSSITYKEPIDTPLSHDPGQTD